MTVDGLSCARRETLNNVSDVPLLGLGEWDKRILLANGVWESDLPELSKGSFRLLTDAAW